MDAPAHVREDGITLDKFGADKFVGKAIVVDCSDLSEGDTIDISINIKVLLKMPNLYYLKLVGINIGIQKNTTVNFQL